MPAVHDELEALAKYLPTGSDDEEHVTVVHDPLAAKYWPGVSAAHAVVGHEFTVDTAKV